MRGRQRNLGRSYELVRRSAREKTRVCVVHGAGLELFLLLLLFDGGDGDRRDCRDLLRRMESGCPVLEHSGGSQSAPQGTGEALGPGRGMGGEPHSGSLAPSGQLPGAGRVGSGGLPGIWNLGGPTRTPDTHRRSLQGMEETTHHIETPVCDNHVPTTYRTASCGDLVSEPQKSVTVTPSGAPFCMQTAGRGTPSVPPWPHPRRRRHAENFPAGRQLMNAAA
jgi:hypothetical protein